MQDARGLIVTGLSRSGTSLTAGCFRACGVYFGATFGPTPGNPHGNLEHRWLKQRRGKFQEVPAGFPGSFLSALAAEGWDGSVPWGVKIGFGGFLELTEAGLVPDVVAITHRPADAIARSRDRVGLGRFPRLQEVQDSAKRMVRQAAPSSTIVRVDTDKLARGGWDQLVPALDALGLPLNVEGIRNWIQPEDWHG